MTLARLAREDGPAAEMIELSGLGREAGNRVPQAGASGQLSHGHGDKLRPAVHLAQAAAVMMLLGQRFKFMSRNQFQELGEYGIIMNKSPTSPLLYSVFTENRYTIKQRRSGFIFNLS